MLTDVNWLYCGVHFVVDQKLMWIRTQLKKRNHAIESFILTSELVVKRNICTLRLGSNLKRKKFFFAINLLLTLGVVIDHIDHK